MARPQPECGTEDLPARSGGSQRNCTQIDRAQLSPEDQVSYDVFEYNTNDYLQGEPYKWYLVRTNTFEGIQTVEGTVNSLRFETVKDYDDWLGRMRNFPAYMDQNIGLMREGIKDHIVLPKVIGEKVLTQLNGMDWQDPTKHGFYKPFKKIPASFSDADKQRLTAAAQQTIKNDVLPAFQRFQRLHAERLLAGVVRARWGHGRFPTVTPPTPIWPGRERQPTSRPQQIHEIGLQEVKRIDAEMDKAREQSGSREPMKNSFSSCGPIRAFTQRARMTCCSTLAPAPRKSIRCW